MTTRLNARERERRGRDCQSRGSGPTGKTAGTRPVQLGVTHSYRPQYSAQFHVIRNMRARCWSSRDIIQLTPKIGGANTAQTRSIQCSPVRTMFTVTLVVRQWCTTLMPPCPLINAHGLLSLSRAFGLSPVPLLAYAITVTQCSSCF